MNIKNLTKEQAIAEHRKMWNWIADKLEEAEEFKNDGNLKSYLYNILKLKKKYIEIRGFKNIFCDCFCCEYEYQQQVRMGDNHKEDCVLCPLLWGTEDKVNTSFCERGMDIADFKRKYDIDFLTPFKTIGLWEMANKLSAYHKYKEAAEIARQIANLPEKEIDHV